MILKSPYIKGGKGASKHMNYIATRDGVKILPQGGKYMEYIATRPGVEKHGEHGLFGDTDGIADIKSVLLNDICKFDLLPLYEQSSTERDDLIAQAREELRELAEFMPRRQQDPALEHRLRQLAKRLESVKGKKSYGYLTKPLKREVDDIMAELMCRPELTECYWRWQEVRDEIARYYGDEPAQEIPITEQKEFRPIKNAIIQTALQMHERQEMAVQTGTTVVGGLIAAIAQTIADAPPAPKRRMEFIDRKRRQELARKRQALGLRGRMEQSL